MQTTKYLQSLLDDENITILEMHYKCLDLENIYTDSIYTRDNLIDIMYEHAKNGDTFYAMARDLDNNSWFELFLFDYSCWGQGCKPIRDKQELAQIFLDGSL